MDVSRKGRGLTYALAISVSLNVILIGAGLWPSSDETEPVDEIVEAAAADQPAPQEPEPAAEGTAEADEDAVADSEPEAIDPEEVQVTIAKVEGSIPQTMGAAAAPYGDFVSATLSRLLVWDMDLRRDLRAGDKVEAAWHLGTSDTVVIEAARFHSQKHNRDITAYRFQATGDKYPSYWSEDGTEIPHRLRNSPLAEYEQITSLLKDRPTHHGMDFKADVGTPVLSTRDGVVTRVNWNWKANGNCVEVRHSDGVLAKYLHLSDNKVKAGDHVKTGQEIALSGNTGRSTGPHLHYQLNQGKKVLDPIDYHGTDRRKLPQGDRTAFDALVKAANERFDTAGALAAK